MKVYEKVYEYYVEQMRNGSLKSGDRMPSLRQCEKMLGVSRTSAETAYLQLAADGYIYSIEKVGYFISDTTLRLFDNERSKSSLLEGSFSREKSMFANSNTSINKKEYYKISKSLDEKEYSKINKSLDEKEYSKINKSIEKNNYPNSNKYEYDLATIGEDKEVSCLNLWRRYMKSALRQEDRLLDYASNQGEADLRQEIASYVRKTRNIICTADDVVIGAGFQNLLQILIPLIPGEKTISFPTKNFADGAAAFKNAGFSVNYRDKESHVIYVTPSYMTKWGQIMDMKRRHEIIDHALNNNHLLIEDDYQNEFVFSSKPTPSLYAMTGGQNVAFLGSFSRVLLPSVRISYLILPRGVRADYQNIKRYYNQTASKAEQIALAQFLRDGHLHRHIKKMRKLYEDKRELMIEALQEKFSDAEITNKIKNTINAKNPSNTKTSDVDSDNASQNSYLKVSILVGESGMEIGLIVEGTNIVSKLERCEVDVNVIEASENRAILLLSCSRIPQADIKNAIEKLNDSLQN